MDGMLNKIFIYMDRRNVSIKEKKVLNVYFWHFYTHQISENNLNI